ncbi:hypothetical protein HMPREF1070_01694, partial [Bacteroides ovatus CL03T12C18]
MFSSIIYYMILIYLHLVFIIELNK